MHTQRNLTRRKLLKKPYRVTEEEIKEAYEAGRSGPDRSDPQSTGKYPKLSRETETEQLVHQQKPSGTMLGQKVTPLERVGVYVPGGKAVYPSSVLMNIVPAKVAGVDQIVMTTPPGKDGKVNPYHSGSGKRSRCR